MKAKKAISPHSYHKGAYVEALKLRATKRLTGSEIARRLGLSRETVCNWLRTEQRYGAVRVQAHNTIEYRRALQLWRKEKGALSAYAIARKAGAPESLVRTWIKKEREHAEQS